MDSIQCNSNQKWNNDKCWCGYTNPKEHNVCRKDYIWNPATCSCENAKYSGSIIDGLVIACGHKILQKKIVPRNNTSTNLYLLFAFLLITIALLKTVSIHLIKHRSKKTLPYVAIYNKSKEILY